MKDLLILIVHLLTTIAKVLGPGGARSIIADSLLMKQQLLIINRSRQRAPNLSALDRFLLGFWFLVAVPKPTPPQAGCRHYPAIDAIEIPQPTQTEKVSTTIYISWQ